MTKISVHPLPLRPDGWGGSDSSSAPFYPLGCLMAYVRKHRDGALNEVFDLRATTPRRRSGAIALFEDTLREPGIFLFSSFVWNHQANLEVAEFVKRRSPGSMTIFGGPHIPRRRLEVLELFRKHPYIDVVARGEGEMTTAEILDALSAAGALDVAALADVPGITFRGRDGAVVQNADRARMKDLSVFPSPYLDGEFEPWIEGAEYAFMETNRGCPYGCSFCDWGAATLAKIHLMSQERVFGELEFLGRRKILGFMICDANFGMLPRDLEIARHLVAVHEKYGFPQEVSYTSAKNAKPQFQEIMKLLRNAGLAKVGQISMQTIDQTVLDIAKRSNIKSSEYDKFIRFFHEENIPPASDMMVGLPGQTLETTKRDLQFFFDRMVTTTIHATTVMPNAPISDPEYMAKYQIVVDSEAFVESTFSFTKEQYQEILALCYTYKFFVKVGVGRYFLYYLQREHGIPAVDFLASWRASAHRYPISARVKRHLLDRDYHSNQKHWFVVAWGDDESSFLFDDTQAFYRELLTFAADEFGVHAEGSDVEAVIAAQAAVMPNKARTYPASVPLSHDFVSYFQAIRRAGGIASPLDVPPLRDFGPGVLELPEQPPCTNYGFGDMDPSVARFELRSSLTVPQGRPSSKAS